jgi:hypothetical protein
LSQLEKGLNPATGKPSRPDEDVVKRIARALGEAEEDALAAAGYGALPPRVEQIARRMARLRPDELEAMERIVDSLTAGRVMHPSLLNLRPAGSEVHAALL